ncbi:hypothetical protein EC988_007940, partial [Linderina pennispora]
GAAADKPGLEHCQPLRRPDCQLGPWRRPLWAGPERPAQVPKYSRVRQPGWRLRPQRRPGSAC